MLYEKRKKDYRYLPKGNFSDRLFMGLKHLDVIHVGLPVLRKTNKKWLTTKIIKRKSKSIELSSQPTVLENGRKLLKSNASSCFENVMQ
jgi:hypothetical protein